MKTNKKEQRLEKVYKSEKPRLLNRLRRIGKTLEEAEDLVQDVYLETMERMSIVPRIPNLAASLNWLVKRRLIDTWRHEEVKKSSGEIQVAEDVLRDIITEVGLNPLDEYVRDCLTDELNDAIHALPKEQRRIIEAQVFGGLTFREISESTGESINTLTARKRYAIKNLSLALKSWITE